MALAGFEKVFKHFALETVARDPPKPSTKREKTFVRYCEVAKAKDGKRTFVAHKATLKKKSVQAASKDKKTNNNKTKEGGEDRGEGIVKKSGPADQMPDNEANFTSEEDGKLKALKTTNTSWKDISAELGRPLNVLKSRWKELQKDADTAVILTGNVEDAKKEAGGSGKAQKGKKDVKPGGPDWKNMTPSEKKAEGLRRKALKEAGEEPKQTPRQDEEKKKEDISVDDIGNSSSEARFTMQEWMTLQEDDMFSFDEIKCISDIMAKRSDQTWDRIASRFFDKTGRRVHALDIRDKFQGLAKIQQNQT